MTKLEMALENCRLLLTDVGETFWSGKICTVLRNCQAGGNDPSDIVLSWFGGMGSFNDLLIDPRNGHNVDPETARLKNEQLRRLRSAIYDNLIAQRGQTSR